MADTLERKIPYLFPGDLELRLDAQNFVTAISGYPVGGGGGTIVESDFIWKPVINQDGTIGWARDTSATAPATANLVPHIYNNYWYIGTSNTNVEARGPQGPAGADGTNGTDGKDGEDGKDGISPTVTTATIEGGNRVIFTYGEGSTESIDVMSGASGAKGSDGYSPTVTVTNIPADPDDPNHKNGGTEITITDATTTNKFSAWNGNDGTMAGAPGIEGSNGISAALDGSTYKVGLSSTFYTYVTTVSSKADKTDLQYVSAGVDYVSGAIPDTSDMATMTWVGQQNYLTSVPSEYITESELSTTLANYMQSVSTGTGLSGDGTTNSPLGIKTDAALNLTNASAKSAISAASAYNAQYFTSGNKVVAISTYATLTDLAIDSLHADEPGYREEELDEPPLIAEYAASAYLGPNTYLGFDKFVTSGDYISGDKQYVLTSGGWQELEGGSSFTGVTTTGSISGGGVNNDTIGLITSAEEALSAIDNKADQNGNYQNLSAGSATSAYTTYSANYATTAASAYIDSNTTSAMSDIVDELHSKTSVTINTTNNEIKDGTSAVSAMSYIANSQHAGWLPQKTCVCQDSEIYAMSLLAEGQGMLFFVVSAH